MTFYAFLVACCAIGVKAQQCIPDPVDNVKLTNTTLSWESSVNCPITHYIVNIHSNGVLEYVYQVDNATLNVSFLSLCRTYTFVVTAIADHIIGAETQYNAVIPLPANAKITVNNFTGDQIDRDVLFQWHVLPEYAYCAEDYKLLLWEGDSAAPQTINTNQNGYFVKNVSQCMEFRLEISVDYLGEQYPVAQFNYTVPPATNPPTLLSLIQDALTINTTWALESYAINQCAVTAIHLAGPHINITVPIHDTPQRPSIEVSVPGLRANSMYYLNVTVQNVAGISRPFQLAVQTLPVEFDSDLEISDSVDIINVVCTCFLLFIKESDRKSVV